MYGNNPFAQGGWPNPENPLSINNGTWGTMLLDGPAYGALPTAPDTQNAYLRFYFTDFNPNILNCTIVGPRNTIYYKVIPGPPGVTLVQKPDYSSILFIEWRASPIIDIRDIVPQQLVRQWFTAGAKPGSRIFDVKGKRYGWEENAGCMELLSIYPGPSQPCHAKFFQQGDSIILDISTQGIHLGLLEVSIASIILLKSGANLD